MSLLCKYKHIIWDWNGTLLNDVDLSLELINDLLSRYDLDPITLKYYREVFGFPVKQYYHRVGFDFSKVTFETVALQFIDAYNLRRYEAGLFAGVKELLTELIDMGKGHSVLSAYRHSDLQTIIEHFEIDHFFERVSGISDQFAASKIENGKLLIEELCHTPEDVVLIGDTENDFEVAQAMGIECILVSHGHHSEERLRKCGVPVVRSLNDMHP